MLITITIIIIIICPQKNKILACSMIESQFVYCPLIWMFCLNTDIQRCNKYKTLHVAYNNCMAIYDDLLALHNKLKTHQRHLQFLDIEIYKFKSKPNPSFMWKTYKKGYFSLNFKRKHSEISSKFIKFQRKCFVEQPTNKVKKCKFLQEFKLLLKQSGNLPCTCPACKA